MEGIQYHAQFWSFMLFYCLASIVLLTVPRFRGKGWLLSFLAISLVLQPFYYVPEILQRNEVITVNTYSRYLNTLFPLTRLLYAVGDGFLIAFILELKSTMAGRQSAAKVLFSFAGRVPRHMYWIAMLTMLAINLRVWSAIVDPASKSDNAVIVGWVSYVLWLPFAVWIALAVQIKRWHDLDKSGWWVLVGLIPIIGGFWVLIENGCIEGTKGPNRFGSNPNEPEPNIPDVQGFATSRL